MKILIATDGSKFSEAALEKICRMISDPENTEIKIVSSYEQPFMAVSAPYAMPVAYNPVLEAELKDIAKQAVSRAEIKILECFPGIENRLTTQVLCGTPGQLIVEEAEKFGADLIVVGSHGYGFWQRTLLGSVSNSIVHHAPCSVLIVREPNAAD